MDDILEKIIGGCVSIGVILILLGKCTSPEMVHIPNGKGVCSSCNGTGYALNILWGLGECDNCRGKGYIAQSNVIHFFSAEEDSEEDENSLIEDDNTLYNDEDLSTYDNDEVSSSDANDYIIEQPVAPTNIQPAHYYSEPVQVEDVKPNQGHQCRLCNGTGRKISEYYWGQSGTETKWCDECHKTVGIAHSHHYCDLCGGDGWIEGY